MGQSITPIAYRVGFFRVWDSLYTESLYLKNYNLFFKSQMLYLYVQGFFNKWTWDGRRSYFLNFIFSHLEISWSYNYVQLYVYVYNSGVEHLQYNLKKIFFYNKNLKNLYNKIYVKKNITRKVKYLQKYLKNLDSLMNFYYKFVDMKKGFRALFSRSYVRKHKKYFKKIVDLEVNKKRSNFYKFKKFIRRLAIFKQRFFSKKKGVIQRYGVF